MNATRSSTRSFPCELSLPSLLLPCSDECFLSEVFAVTQASRRAVSQRTHHGLVARHNLSKGVAIAFQAFGHQPGVVLRGSLHCCVRYHITAYVAISAGKVTGILWRCRQFPLLLNPPRAHLPRRATERNVKNDLVFTGGPRLHNAITSQFPDFLGSAQGYLLITQVLTTGSASSTDGDSVALLANLGSRRELGEGFAEFRESRDDRVDVPGLQV